MLKSFKGDIMKKSIHSLTILFLLTLALPGHAITSGGGCKEQTEEPKYDLKKHQNNVNTSALTLYNYLDKNVAKVAIVARAGRDLSEEDFRYPQDQKYTHAGLVWKSSLDGKWRFKHVLNICAGDSSKIFVQSLAQFFNDDPFSYDFVVIVPSEELQDKIVPILEKKNGLAEDLQNPRYSNIANPFALKYQNSNGWVLQVLAAAESGKSTQRGTMYYYQKMGYRPSQVKISWWRKLGAFFVANAHTDDHPGGDSWYDFVSAESLYGWLKHRGKLMTREDFCHSTGCNVPLTTLNQFDN